MTTIKKSKLGELLVATRHCFYYSNELQAYVRMELCGGKDLLRVEVCPAEQIQKLLCGGHGPRNTRYLSWREDPEKGREIIESLKFPAMRFSQYTSFSFNTQGEPVQ